MSRLYSLTEANALIPELVVLAERLRMLRDDVVSLRDAYRDRETVVLEELVDATGPDATGLGDWPGPGQAGGADGAGGSGGQAEPELGPEPLDPELRMLRLRMRGLVDQMQADAAWLDDRDIVLRDIGGGLLDFPGEAGGREIWLCWRLGEPSVLFWHMQNEGFANRRPIAESSLSTPA